ncbi:MAG: HU family DNA-binding protein [Christensenella sp.]|nr:HU family DNA-binding protein [Christensenella sp.]
MNKIELIDVVAEATGLKKVDAQKALDAAIAGIADALKKGDKVTLQGFGTFEVKVKAARKGTNPATHETIDIPESKAVKFKAGKALKDTL